MNTQAWRCLITALLIAAATAHPIVTQATMITANISDTGLSGTFKYDDTTTIAGTGGWSDWTFTAITSFMAMYDPYGTSWDTGDYADAPTYDLFYAMDGVGHYGIWSYDTTNAVLAAAHFSNGAGYDLVLAGYIFCTTNCTISTNEYTVIDPSGNSETGGYRISANVDEPGVLSLLCLGFAALGITGRRMKA
jgi:hypothetical protein